MIQVQLGGSEMVLRLKGKVARVANGPTALVLEMSPRAAEILNANMDLKRELHDTMLSLLINLKGAVITENFALLRAMRDATPPK